MRNDPGSWCRRSSTSCLMSYEAYKKETNNCVRLSMCREGNMRGVRRVKEHDNMDKMLTGAATVVHIVFKL